MGFFSKLDKREKIAFIIGQLRFFGIIYWIYNNYDESVYWVQTIIVFTLPMLLWIFTLYRVMRLEKIEREKPWPYLLGMACFTIILFVYYAFLWSDWPNH